MLYESGFNAGAEEPALNSRRAETMTETGANMTETKLRDETSDLAADLAALRADIVKLTTSVATLVKSETATKTDSLHDAVDAARRRLSDGAADAKDRLSGASSDLEAKIERNPLIAVLIAMAAGLVIGLISRGRK
jgi:ElaB/YqjD/DUF883 family membrane-anchored ribosome-binding protein